MKRKFTTLFLLAIFLISSASSAVHGSPASLASDDMALIKENMNASSSAESLSSLLNNSFSPLLMEADGSDPLLPWVQEALDLANQYLPYTENGEYTLHIEPIINLGFMKIQLGFQIQVSDKDRTREIKFSFEFIEKFSLVDLKEKANFMEFDLFAKIFNTFLAGDMGKIVKDIGIDYRIAGSVGFIYHLDDKTIEMTEYTLRELEISVTFTIRLLHLIFLVTGAVAAYKALVQLPEWVQDLAVSEIKIGGKFSGKLKLGDNPVATFTAMGYLDVIPLKIDAMPILEASANLHGDISIVRTITNTEKTIEWGGSVTAGWSMKLGHEIFGIGWTGEQTLWEKPVRKVDASEFYTANVLLFPENENVDLSKSYTSIRKGDYYSLQSEISNDRGSASNFNGKWVIRNSNGVKIKDIYPSIANSGSLSRSNIYMDLEATQELYTIELVNLENNDIIVSKQITVLGNDKYKYPIPSVNVNGFNPYASSGHQTVEFTLKNIWSQSSGGGSGLHIALDNAKITDIQSSDFPGIIYLANVDLETGENSYHQTKDNIDDLDFSDTYNLIEVYGEIPPISSLSLTLDIEITSSDPVLNYRSWLGDPDDWVWSPNFKEYLPRWHRSPGGTSYQEFEVFTDLPVNSIYGDASTISNVLIKTYDISDNQIDLSWEKYAGDIPIKGYIIQESTSSNFDKDLEEWFTDALSYQTDIRGTAGKEITLYYRIQVLTSDNRRSSGSSHVRFRIDRTLDSDSDRFPVPIPPTFSRSIYNVDEDEFSISWRPAYYSSSDSYCCYYQVELQKPNNNQLSYYEVSSQNFRYKNAQEGDYIIRVRAYSSSKDVGLSDWSTYITVTVDIPEPPSDRFIVDRPFFRLYGSSLVIIVDHVRRSDETAMITYADSAQYFIYSYTTNELLHSGDLEYQKDKSRWQSYYDEQWVALVDPSDIDIDPNQRYYVQVYFEDQYSKGWSEVHGSDLVNVANFADNIGSYGGINDYSLSFDFDGDGINDKITTHGGVVHIHNLDGESIEGWPISIPAAVFVTYLVEDIENDGTYELVFRYRTKLDTRVAVYHINGTIKYDPMIYPKTDNDDSGPILATDLNSDGVLDIITTISSDGKNELYARDILGNDIFPKIIIDSGRHYSGVRALYLLDFDSDNELEFLLVGMHHIVTISLGGVIENSFALPTSNSFDPIVYLTDMTNDGTLDLVLSTAGNSIYIFYAGSNWWNSYSYQSWNSETEYYMRIRAVGNFDDDPYYEIIISGGSDRYPYYSGDGGSLTYIVYTYYKVDLSENLNLIKPSQPLFRSRGTENLLAYDFDQDGKHEIILPGVGIVNHLGELVMHDLNVGWYYTNTILCDPDEDGLLDVHSSTQSVELTQVWNLESLPKKYGVSFIPTSYHVKPIIHWFGTNLSSKKYEVIANGFAYNALLDHVNITIDEILYASLPINHYTLHLAENLHLDEGFHNITLSIKDARGMIRHVSRIIEIDATSPSLIYSNLPDIAQLITTSAFSIDINLQFSDEHGVAPNSNFLSETNAAQISTKGGWVNITMSLSTGYQVYYVEVFDELGNPTVIPIKIMRIRSVDPPTALEIYQNNFGLLLDWERPHSDPGLDIVSFGIYKSVNNSEYIWVANTTLSTFVDTNVMSNSNYSYYIITYNIVEESLPSSIYGITYLKKVDLMPNQVENISLSSKDGLIALSWDPYVNSSSEIVAFRIYRRISNQGFVLLSLVRSDVSSFIDSDFGINDYNLTFFYSISAVNNNGEGYSSAEYAQIRKGGVAPLDVVPTLQGNFTGSAILLEWNYGLDNVLFEIHRKSGDSPYQLLIITNDTLYYDAHIVADTTFTYKVRAINSFTSGEFSDPVEITVDELDPAIAGLSIPSEFLLITLGIVGLGLIVYTIIRRSLNRTQ